MANWTPELEQAIRIIGDFMEAQGKDAANHGLSIDGAIASMTERFNNVGNPAYARAFELAGMEDGDGAVFRKNIAALIKLAAENGSAAADKIVQSIESERATRRAHPELQGLHGDTPETMKQILQILRAPG